MGKKSKKLNKSIDRQPLDTAEEKDFKKDKSKPTESILNLETNMCSASDSTNSVTKWKKKNRKRDFNSVVTDNTPVQIKAEEVNEKDATEAPSIKKKKKKDRPEPDQNEPEVVKEAQVHYIIDQQIIHKKKKKKGNLLSGELKQDMEHIHVKIENQTDSKQNNTKDNLFNSPKSQQVIQKKDGEVKQKKKKPKKKAKTGAPVLNDEESQVTQEDIDKFCDELDEDDNKQYEDWVQLLDAKLGKKQPKQE